MPNRITNVADVTLAISILSENSLEAFRILTTMLEYCPRVDPNDVNKGVAWFQLLDRLDITGDKIVILWRDVCHGNYANMIALFRSCTLDFAVIDDDVIKHAVEECEQGLKGRLIIKVIISEVQKALPDFNPDA